MAAGNEAEMARSDTMSTAHAPAATLSDDGKAIILTHAARVTMRGETFPHRAELRGKGWTWDARGQWWAKDLAAGTRIRIRAGVTIYGHISHMTQRLWPVAAPAPAPLPARMDGEGLLEWERRCETAGALLTMQQAARMSGPDTEASDW
jgi:hypothetical protein